MLALLPFLGLASLFVGLRLWTPSADWRRDLTRAGLLFGAIAIWLTQILSGFSAVTPWALTAAWIAVILLTVGLAGARRSAAWSTLRPRLPGDWDRWDWALAACVAVIVGVTAVVALASPPQTWDTLNYHMARVGHWAQMASVRPYATGIEIQNSMPPGAEILYLQPYVLGAGDASVNLVDWSATWIVVLAVSFLAKQLGAGRRGQWLAAVFMASMPMTIVQAGSTMTDVVLAVWLVGVTVELMAVSKSDDAGPGAFLLMAMGAGLAIVTKPTAFSYLLPLAAWALILLLRRRPLRRQVGLALLGGALVLSINWGYFSGNLRLYHNPVAPSNRISEHSSPWLGGRAFLSNLLRNAAYQLATPSPHVNKAVALSVITIHNWMGLDPSDPRTTAAGRFKVSLPTTKEDLAQNPLQMVLILGSGVLLFLRRRDLPDGLMGYGLVVALAFVAFSLLYKWQVFGSRYLLPFFALAGPGVGVLAERILDRRGTYALAALLVLASVPWLFGVQTRPLLARDENGRWTSILSTSRTMLIFGNGPYLEKPYVDMTDQIKAAGCGQVGLMLSGAQAEYPLWSLLGAPKSGVDIEWIVAGTPSAALRPPDFSPCAEIRESDGAFPEEADGLALAYRYGAFGLYLQQSGGGP
jgi:hypothetical protein